MILHGGGQPKLILDYGGANERTITLPYCKNMIEKFSPEIYQFKLYNGTIYTKINGWWYSIELDYSPYISTEVLNQLHDGTAKLFTTTSRGQMRLYPHNSSVYYKVELDASSILNIFHKPFEQGIGGVKINFVGTELITTIDLTTNV